MGIKIGDKIKLKNISSRQADEQRIPLATWRRMQKKVLHTVVKPKISYAIPTDVVYINWKGYDWYIFERYVELISSQLVNGQLEFSFMKEKRSK